MGSLGFRLDHPRTRARTCANSAPNGPMPLQAASNSQRWCRQRDPINVIQVASSESGRSSTNASCRASAKNRGPVSFLGRLLELRAWSILGKRKDSILSETTWPTETFLAFLVALGAVPEFAFP